jgi:hypothetical protein
MRYVASWGRHTALLLAPSICPVISCGPSLWLFCLLVVGIQRLVGTVFSNILFDVAFPLLLNEREADAGLCVH